MISNSCFGWGVSSLFVSLVEDGDVATVVFIDVLMDFSVGGGAR